MSESQAAHVACPVLVLRIEDNRLMGDTLAEAIRDEMMARYTAVKGLHAVIDFQSVVYMSSAGFRPLLSLLREVRTHGGRMILCGLSPEVAETFAVTRLISTSGSGPATFEVQPDIASAIAALDLGRRAQAAS